MLNFRQISCPPIAQKEGGKNNLKFKKTKMTKNDLIKFVRQKIGLEL
jgi:hypothetical protein